MDARIGWKRFAASEAELAAGHLQLKLRPCPHCGRVGALIGHGWLRGYEERSCERVIRGARAFCSNRFRRPGCGRTFSVLLAAFLRGFVVRAETLSHFASQVLSGLTRKAAWRASAEGALSTSSGYRLWRRLVRAQASLRTHLCRLCAPPDSGHDEPLAGLLAHFSLAFPGVGCVLSEYQLRAGRDLFE